jgi:putative toxin-antitoxin system antitoxin component (TIGR02293 family)
MTVSILSSPTPYDICLGFFDNCHKFFYLSSMQEMNQKFVSKSGATKSTKSGRSKSTEGTNTKTKVSRGRNNPQPEKNELKYRLKNGSIFSYKSADDKNLLAIIDAVRTGISFNDFKNIVSDTPFSLAEWANYLQVSERTIQRNQTQKKPFQPIHSERIVELVMLYQYGVEVFGDKDNFNVWLNSKSIALGGRTPKELLDTKFGVGMVKDELGRIEHGVLS